MSPFSSTSVFVPCPRGVTLFGGDDGIRTHDPLLAGQVLSQLSYTPIESDSKQHLESFILRKILLFLQFFFKDPSKLNNEVDGTVFLAYIQSLDISDSP